MKKRKAIRGPRVIFMVCTLLVAILVLSSCSTTKYNFSTSSAVTAAEGTVKVKKDGNNNYKVDLNVMRLAEASRLSPPRGDVRRLDGNGAERKKNIGQLKTSSGFLSKTLKSSLNTVSSFKPTGFFITAEDDANVSYPGTVILSTGGN